MEYIVPILEIEEVANRVKRFRIEKPTGYSFEPGQATDVSVNTPALKNELRPFTFTGLPVDPFLEFTIKRYPDHHGVTDAIHQLRVGDELVIREVWGAITYKGPGCFIAGGAGITPFLAILRWLHRQNKLDGNSLFFSNHTREDIICEEELQAMLGSRAFFILTQQEKAGYLKGPVNADFLEAHVKNMQQHFYVCGPDKMITDIANILGQMGAGAEAVVFEK